MLRVMFVFECQPETAQVNSFIYEIGVTSESGPAKRAYRVGEPAGQPPPDSLSIPPDLERTPPFYTNRYLVLNLSNVNSSLAPAARV